MNREIKFRAWDEDDKEMYFPVIFSMPVFKPLRRCKDGCSAYKDHHVMQYTGLKTKGGTEIYEGDIVKYELPTHGEDYKPTGETEFYTEQVIFKDGQFQVEEIPLYAAVDFECEVIGDIHTTPELLTQ